MNGFLEEVVEKLNRENEKNGIMWPFLFHSRTNKMLRAKLIKTSRPDSFNVCWAAIDPTKGKPNGIFISANSDDYKNLSVVEVLVNFKISSIALVQNEDEWSIKFSPTKEDYDNIFTCFGALHVTSKGQLT